MTSTASNHSGQLLVISGPSAVGKSTISRRLAAEIHITYAVSVTTRTQRPGDEAGKEYQYVTADEFFRRLDSDEFLEYAQVYGDYYGTPKHPTLDQLARGQDVLLEIDVQGALQVRYQYPHAILVFIMPPDEPTLLRRLQERARDSSEEMARRFRAAKREIHMAKGSKAFDEWIVNDQVESAVKKLCDIVRRKRDNIASA
jgi:guanylate kinase